MSTGEILTISVNVGAISNETVPFWKTPTDPHGGGITILEAYVIQGGTPNSSLRLVTLGTAGTTVSGTITTTAIGGTASQFVNNRPKGFTIATNFVDANTWIGLKEYNVQAGNAVCIATINYLIGRTGG